jgi:hypothetical protein
MDYSNERIEPEEREVMERYIARSYGWENNQDVRQKLSELTPAQLREEHRGAYEAVMAVNAEEQEWIIAEKESAYRIKAW